MSRKKFVKLILISGTVSTLCLIGILIIAICFGFDEKVILCGVTTFVGCVITWANYFTVKKQMKNQD